MSVTARFQLEKPDEMNATIQVTMSVAEWRGIREATRSGTSYSTTMLTRAIDELLSQADKVFYARITDKDTAA